MVQVWCHICGTTFETAIDELWVCPGCDEAGNVIFDVQSASYDELIMSWELLQKGRQVRDISKIIGSNNYIFFGDYYNEEIINDSIIPLLLLFDKVLIKDKLLISFFDKIHRLNYFENLLDEKWVVPITGFSGGTIYAFDDFKDYCIDHFDIINHTVWGNLTKILSREYINILINKPNMKDFIEDTVKRADIKSPFPLESFKVILDFNFADQIMISQLNSPSFLQPYQQNIMNCYLKDIIKQNVDPNHEKEIEVFKHFLERLEINIPLNVKFDDLKQFRNDKTCIELRNTLFDVTTNSRSTSDYEMVNDLIWRFYEKLQDYNEAVESFSFYKTGMLTGMTSTIGGLLGGTEGAITAGLGSTGSMFLGNTVFKEYFRKKHQNWAYFLWKLKMPK